MKIWAKRNRNVRDIFLFILEVFFNLFKCISCLGCCIYRKPLEFGESSSEEDDDECEHCFGHVEKKKKNPKHHHSNGDHNCEHGNHSSDRGEKSCSS